MQRFGKVGAAGLMLTGCLFMTPTAQAAAPVTGGGAPPAPHVAGGTVQMLDCGGTTGAAGCGPGWFWRDGWRGRGCYPC